jgi:hypothetical protein
MSEAYRLHMARKLGVQLYVRQREAIASLVRPDYFLRATGAESQACNASVFMSVRLPTLIADNLPSLIAAQIVVWPMPSAVAASLTP